MGTRAAPKVRHPIALDTEVRESGRCWTALLCWGVGEGGVGAGAVLLFLARRPVVAHAQLGPGDGHLVRAGGAHLRREVDDAAVVLHVLELVLLGGLHVDHRVLVHMLLQDHSLSRTGKKEHIPLLSGGK